MALLYGTSTVLPRLLKSCVAVVAVPGIDARYRRSVAGPPYFVPQGRVMERSRKVRHYNLYCAYITKLVPFGGHQKPFFSSPTACM